MIVPQLIKYKDRYPKALLLFGIFSIIISCSKDYETNLPGINFGTATYHDSFLIYDSENIPVNRKIKIDFNDWATQNNAYADLQLVDENGNKIGLPGTGVNLFVNDKHIKNAVIQLTTKVNTSETLIIELQFDPSNESRSVSGFVIMTNGNVERINNIETHEAGIEVFKWNAHQNVIMNPLKKALIWFLLILLIAIVIWFFILRNKFFPKMDRGQIILNTPYYRSISTKGARGIVLTNKTLKQSFLNKLFAGKIIYEKNDLWQEEVKFFPARRRQLRIKMPSTYDINPFTSKIDQGKTYIIKGNQEEVKFSFL